LLIVIVFKRISIRLENFQFRVKIVYFSINLYLFEATNKCSTDINKKYNVKQPNVKRPMKLPKVKRPNVKRPKSAYHVG